jgi:hypothetical protein
MMNNFLFTILLFAVLILFQESSAKSTTERHIQTVEIVRSSNDDDSSGPVASAAVLRFLLLGDWGKGGITGTYGSVASSPSNKREHIVNSLDASNSTSNDNEGKIIS